MGTAPVPSTDCKSKVRRVVSEGSQSRTEGGANFCEVSRSGKPLYIVCKCVLVVAMRRIGQWGTSVVNNMAKKIGSENRLGRGDGTQYPPFELARTLTPYPPSGGGVQMTSNQVVTHKSLRRIGPSPAWSRALAKQWIRSATKTEAI